MNNDRDTNHKDYRQYKGFSNYMELQVLKKLQEIT